MLSAALNIAASGLMANNAKANTHATNIANADTPGYRRRDDVMTEMVNGGVRYSSVHRFNEVTANRLSLLAGEEQASATLASSLSMTQAQMSSASTELADAQNALGTALYQASVNPNDQTAKTVAAEKAQGLASIANTHLQELDRRVVDEKRAQGEVNQQAQAKIQELAMLNRQVNQLGATPDLKDRLAQTGRELAELVGGEVSFAANGKAEFTVGTTRVVGADDTVQALPAEVGGKLGGHIAAEKEILATRNDFSAGLQKFADDMNSLNAQGTDATGNAGGNLFSLSADGFKFDGNVNSFALNSTSGKNIGQSMAELGSLSKMTGSIASSVASKTSLARTTSEVQGMSLGSWEAKYQKEEGVDVDMEAIHLKTAQRAYEANAKVISVADSMLGTLLSIKG